MSVKCLWRRRARLRRRVGVNAVNLKLSPSQLDSAELKLVMFTDRLHFELSWLGAY